MEKLDPKTDGATPSIVDQNIERLRELFPEAFTEGSDEHGPRWKVDFNALREILGGYAEEQAERYSFTWNGKARARRIPVHRGRQPRSLEALTEKLPQEGQDDLYRSAIQHGQ